MAKKNKKRNWVAEALIDALFRQRVIRDKKKEANKKKARQKVDISA